MKPLRLMTKQIEKIFFEDSERFFVVESGNWVSQGKYETKKLIFEDDETGIKYEAYVTRTGSYYSDWTYESEYDNKVETVFPVELKPVTKMVWTAVEADTDEEYEDLTEEVEI